MKFSWEELKDVKNEKRNYRVERNSQSSSCNVTTEKIWNFLL